MSFERLRWTTGIALVLFALVAGSIIGFGLLSKNSMLVAHPSQPEPALVPNRPENAPMRMMVVPEAPPASAKTPAAPVAKKQSLPTPAMMPVTSPSTTQASPTPAPMPEQMRTMVRRRTRAS